MADYPPPPPYQKSYDIQQGPVVTLPQAQQIVINQPIQLRFNDLPTNVQCPHCLAQVTTRVIFKTGTITWLIAGGLCLVAHYLIFPCFLPFCLDSCKDAEHFCPSCGQFIGACRKLD